MPLPILDPVLDVLERLQGVKREGEGWQALCPAHEDSTPSLSIARGREGRVLLHCHAGCPLTAVLAAIDLAPGDLFSSPPTNGKRSTLEIAREYNYVDAEGTLVFQVVRLLPKDFRQRRPDGNGGWIWNLKGTTRVLYRLPEVLRAVQDRRVVFIVEGEKDADALAALHLVATTNPAGVGKWQESFSTIFRDALVVLLPDNDDQGRTHMARVAESLAPFTADLRLVELPDLPKKGDVSDWLAKGGTAESLKELVRRTPRWTLPPAPPTSLRPPDPPIDERFKLTDLGNAERLLHRHGADVRYVAVWKTWLLWDRIRWARDRTRRVESLAKSTVRAIYDEAKAAPSDRSEALGKHAAKSEGDSRIRALIARAEAEPACALLPEQLDSNPWLLTVKNGTLDLRTGELGPHDRTQLGTRWTDLPYEPTARCPLWTRFIDRVLDGNTSLQTFLQRAVGYSLTGSTREQCLFFLHGIGANGKSTFLEILRSLLGYEAGGPLDGYAAQADFTTFLEKQHDGPRNDVARLMGARVVTSSEVGEGKRLDESLVKSLTGADTIAARFLYSEAFEFRPTFKLWLAANHKPVVRGTDDAIWRRILLVPFTVQIPEAERDLGLVEVLRTELPGILRWAVLGCLAWQDGGLQAPETVKEATAEYRHDSDVLGAFLEAKCVLDPQTSVGASELYAVYKAWAESGSEFVWSQTMFGRRLTERGIVSEKGGPSNEKRRVGVRLEQTPQTELGGLS